MEVLTRAIANEYRDRALLLPSNGLQDIGERRKLREELQARCNLTEMQAVNIIDCKPAYCRKRWYMMGGNFLYTSDSRFKEITGISYPIAIHDRYEGR